LLYKALQAGQRHQPLRAVIQKASERPSEPARTGEENRERLEARARVLAAFAITPQNRFFLKRIAATCVEHRVACRIIIEPMPASLPRVSTSKVRNLVPEIAVVDVNDFASFPDSAFRDGVHLRNPGWSSYYRTILSEQGLMRFGATLPTAKPWNGKELPTIAGSDDERLIRAAGFHNSEGWGTWTDGTHAEALINIADNIDRDRVLTIAIRTLVAQGPQRVMVMINEEELCSGVFSDSGDKTLSCRLSREVKGPTKIDFLTSYASCPKDWGGEDSRSLGVGLRSMIIE
jgi:hypothetical protein